MEQDDIEMMMLLLLYKQHVRKNAFVVHSRYRKTFLKKLISQQRLFRQRIPRVALQDATHSAWKTLFHSGNDQALITLTGLDFETFNWICPKFSILYDTHSPFVDPDGRIVPLRNPPVNQGGRPRMLSGADCLGLCLAWTRTRGSITVFQIIFGMTGTPVSMYLRFGRRILNEVLDAEPFAAIKMPSIEMIRTLQEVIRQKHPALDGAWCCMDGLQLYLQQAGNSNTQNRFYNGWTIPICCYNLPGLIQDSFLVAEWGNIYPKLERVYNTVGGRCAVDSAFSFQRYPFHQIGSATSCHQ
jgi:hypothetical protein